MLGSGLMRDVDGDLAAAVSAINGHGGFVLALDIPTGVNGDTGAVMGCAVKADLTVTFVGLKTGLFLDAGPEHCGELAFAGLDIGDECSRNSRAEYRSVDADRIATLLPRRRRNAHKGDFGHVLVVGGGRGMPGAVRLCGEAALRAGAGLVSVATDPTHASAIVASRPELMSHPINEVNDLDELIEKSSVIAFGPGLGKSAWAAGIVKRIASGRRPAVWDADALNWLAESPATAEDRVITPHPGEAATLLGSTTAAVQGDRRAALDALQQRYGGVAVLKGSGSLVSSSSGAPWLCTAGNPGMAAPGMGDVLTGIIAAFIAQGLCIDDAAAVGVKVHALAGDLAAANGERGLLASDLVAELRGGINI
jgi:NAD(P)H-hydrate epimerase